MIEKIKKLTLLGLSIFMSQVTLGVQNSNQIQNQNFIDTSLYMKQRYNATACEDQQLLTIFSKIKEEIGIVVEMPLFVIEHTPPDCPYGDGFAFYNDDYKAVCIVASNFYKLSDLARIKVFAHELRHHLQHPVSRYEDDVQIGKILEKYRTEKNMGYLQAAEHDADKFGIEYACKKCPYCIKELRREEHYMIFWFVKDNSGYFEWCDFQELLNQANENPVFCKRHLCDKEIKQFYMQECIHQIKPVVVIAATIYAAMWLKKLANSGF